VLRDKPGYGHDTRPLILVRGVDRCGKNDFQRGHPNATPKGLPRNNCPRSSGGLLNDPSHAGREPSEIWSTYFVAGPKVPA
jgi:hypothetical protein